MAIYGQRVRSRNEPGLVEGMNGHIHQQRTGHRFPESAEMRAEEKVGPDISRPADRPLRNEIPECADTRIVAAVLHDGMRPPRAFRRTNDVQAILHRLCQGFFRKHVAAQLKSRDPDRMVA